MRTAPSEAKILLTGASGFVGKFVLARLSDAGVLAEQISAVAIEDELISGVGRTRTGDITDENFVREVLHDEQPTAIIHLAAVAAPAEAQKYQSKSWQINVEGTRLLAFHAQSIVPDVRFVFSGSAEAYGDTFNQVEGPVPETATLTPRSFYGATKAVSDIMLGQMRANGFDAIRFRAFNHSGPGQIPAYVIPAFASQIADIEAAKQDPIMNVGNLTSERDFCHVEDVVSAYVSSIFADIPATSPAVYNLCSGKPVQIQCLLDTLLSLSDSTIEVKQDLKRMRPSEVPRAFGDPAAAKRELNWSASIPLEQMLKQSLDFFRLKSRPNG